MKKILTLIIFLVSLITLVSCYTPVDYDTLEKNLNPYINVVKGSKDQFYLNPEEVELQAKVENNYRKSYDIKWYVDGKDINKSSLLFKFTPEKKVHTYEIKFVVTIKFKPQNVVKDSSSTNIDVYDLKGSLKINSDGLTNNILDYDLTADKNKNIDVDLTFNAEKGYLTKQMQIKWYFKYEEEQEELINTTHITKNEENFTDKYTISYLRLTKQGNYLLLAKLYKDDQATDYFISSNPINIEVNNGSSRITTYEITPTKQVYKVDYPQTFDKSKITSVDWQFYQNYNNIQTKTPDNVLSSNNELTINNFDNYNGYLVVKTNSSEYTDPIYSTPIFINTGYKLIHNQEELLQALSSNDSQDKNLLLVSDINYNKNTPLTFTTTKNISGVYKYDPSLPDGQKYKYTKIISTKGIDTLLSVENIDDSVRISNLEFDDVLKYSLYFNQIRNVELNNLNIVNAGQDTANHQDSCAIYNLMSDMKASNIYVTKQREDGHKITAFPQSVFRLDGKDGNSFKETKLTITGDLIFEPKFTQFPIASYRTPLQYLFFKGKGFIRSSVVIGQNFIYIWSNTGSKISWSLDAPTKLFYTSSEKLFTMEGAKLNVNLGEGDTQIPLTILQSVLDSFTDPKGSVEFYNKNNPDTLVQKLILTEYAKNAQSPDDHLRYNYNDYGSPMTAPYTHKNMAYQMDLPKGKYIVKLILGSGNTSQTIGTFEISVE